MPRSQVVIGSETSELSRDDVSRGRFSHNSEFKMWRIAPTNLFKQEKIYIRI